MKISAGLLMYRYIRESPEFFLVHPGGPYFKNKDLGYWTIPKGEVNSDEDLLETALREFSEETGIVASPPFIDLGNIRQKGGKIVYAWAFEKDCLDPIKCNEFNLEWPPGSGKIASFPEVDKGRYFDLDEAMTRINQAQKEFILRLKAHFQ
jgi:predicted NUDIX family NTP pyrophosphohydrolase